MSSFCTHIPRILMPALLCALLLLVVGASASQAQPVRIALSEDSLRAGQIFDIFIVFEGSREFDTVIFPDSTFYEDPFEYRRSVTGINPAGHDSLRTELQFFGSETDTLRNLYTLGVSGADTLLFELPEIPVYFRSALTEEDELRPLKPIFEFGRSILPWLIGVVLLAVIAYLLWKFRKRYLASRKPQKDVAPKSSPPPFINPAQILEQEIERIKQTLEQDTVLVKDYYISLGDALRAYFETVYRFPALEQTTREVLQSVKPRGLNHEIVMMIYQLLRNCDMVKFARNKPDKDRMRADLKGLEDLASAFKKYNARLILQMRLEHERRYNPAHETAGGTR